MEGLKRVLRDEPTLISEALRLILLAVVVLGLRLDEAQVLAVVAASSAVIAVMNRALVTPTATVAATVERQVEARITGHAGELTDTELEMLDRQRDRLNAELNQEFRRRGRRP